MKYIGEHLLPGQIGHILTLIALVAALMATIAYFMANRTAEGEERKSWIKFARWSFFVETISIISIFGLLLYIISNHYHEYFFAWNHSSRSLPSKYLLSCIWEDQSGSFLLWSIWHCVLGWFLIWKSKDWEAGTMFVVNLAQFCIATMLLGIYLFGAKIGNNPFILWRDQMPELPLFTNPDYLQLPRVFEGNDLNTLLQNYWMVIHPPVLFLGFASTVVPFAYAFAGLMNKRHDWVKPVLPWAGFSAAVLGVGIMMGAAWAYESLSFGGYWAWDPVENASLVPWLTLVAGFHVNLIYKSTGYSLRTTYFFYFITFTLILYSTFLTRSGILADTSVHAFTVDDKNLQAIYLQLIGFMMVFFVPAMVLYAKNYKSIPTIKKEEQTYSREFWMFIGSLVLFLGGIVIIAKTSTPVFNKIFSSNIAPPEDPEFAHNQIQIFVAMILGFLTAITQYLKYKDTPRDQFGKKILIPTVLALVISLLVSLFGGIHYGSKGPVFLVAIHIAIFTAIYSVVANASYIWLGLKGKVKAAGASVAHVGFGLVLLGILVSSAKKTVLSWNTTGITPLSKETAKGGQGDPAENLTLFKEIKTDMGKYMVTWIRDTVDNIDHKRYFEIEFVAKDKSDSFKLYPDVMKNNKGMEGFSANPSAKHYWHKDIFGYITSFQENNTADTTTFRNKTIKAGDTLFYGNGLMILEKVSINPIEQKARVQEGEVSLFLNMTIISKDGRRYPANPGIAIKGQALRQLNDTVRSQSLVLQFNKVLDQSTGKLEIGVKESGAITELITLKVYEFPLINVLWLGVVVMTVGIGMSIRQRLLTKTNLKAV
jgi:cytochrome c-type biogenesis protein CcmF